MTTRRWAQLAIRLWRRDCHQKRRDARARLLTAARIFESPEAQAQRAALANLRSQDWSDR